MSQVVLLDNVEHHDLRLITHHSPAFGDNVNLALVVPTEFADVQREYPILFQRSENGTFQAFALLGLDADENLFLDDDGWHARYIPAIQARGPFRIGFREQERDSEQGPEAMIMVDLDHPRISRNDGEPLFLAHGGSAPALDRVTQSLRNLHTGIAGSNAMFAAFEAAGLLAPVNIDIKLDDATQYNLPDFFTVSQEALAQLDAETLHRLNQSGFLGLAYCAILSVGNMGRLIEIKLKRRQNP